MKKQGASNLMGILIVIAIGVFVTIVGVKVSGVFKTDSVTSKTIASIKELGNPAELMFKNVKGGSVKAVCVSKKEALTEVDGNSTISINGAIPDNISDVNPLITLLPESADLIVNYTVLSVDDDILTQGADVYCTSSSDISDNFNIGISNLIGNIRNVTGTYFYGNSKNESIADARGVKYLGAPANNSGQVTNGTIMLGLLGEGVNVELDPNGPSSAYDVYALYPSNGAVNTICTKSSHDDGHSCVSNYNGNIKLVSSSYYGDSNHTDTRFILDKGTGDFSNPLLDETLGDDGLELVDKICYEGNDPNITCGEGTTILDTSTEYQWKVIFTTDDGDVESNISKFITRAPYTGFGDNNNGKIGGMAFY